MVLLPSPQKKKQEGIFLQGSLWGPARTPGGKAHESVLPCPPTPPSAPPRLGPLEFSTLGLVHTEPPAFWQLLLGFTTLALGSQEGSCSTQLWSPVCLCSLGWGEAGVRGRGSGLPGDLTSLMAQRIVDFSVCSASYLLWGQNGNF